jgi:DNA-directed RNA polymerase subunit F
VCNTALDEAKEYLSKYQLDEQTVRKIADFTGNRILDLHHILQQHQKGKALDG